jgi:hypothetical protein
MMKSSIKKTASIKEAKKAIGYNEPDASFIDWLQECGYMLSKCEVNPIYNRAGFLGIIPHKSGRCGKIFISYHGISEMKMKYQ